MANPLQAPRGTTASIETRVLDDGEMAFDLTLERLRVGDGVTAGGLVVMVQGDGETPGDFDSLIIGDDPDIDGSAPGAIGISSTKTTTTRNDREHFNQFVGFWNPSLNDTSGDKRLLYCRVTALGAQTKHEMSGVASYAQNEGTGALDIVYGGISQFLNMGAAAVAINTGMLAGSRQEDDGGTMALSRGLFGFSANNRVSAANSVDDGIGVQAAFSSIAGSKTNLGSAVYAEILHSGAAAALRAIQAFVRLEDAAATVTTAQGLRAGLDNDGTVTNWTAIQIDANVGNAPGGDNFGLYSAHAGWHVIAAGNLGIGDTSPSEGRLVAASTTALPAAVFRGGASGTPVVRIIRDQGSTGIADMTAGGGDVLWDLDNEVGGTAQFGVNSSSEAVVKRADVAGVTLTSSGVKLLGAVNDAAPGAGNVGHLIESEVLAGSAVSLTTATAADVTSISLPAGSYLVWGQVSLALNAATTMTRFDAWISEVSATFPTPPNKGALVGIRTTFETGVAQYLPVGTRLMRLSGTTTVRLSARATFAVNTCAAYGYIGAMRVF